MFRYLKLYGHFLRFSFTKALEFRLDFTFRIFMDLVYHLFNLFFFKILFLHTDAIGGWQEDQMILFVASFILSDALYMSFFANNCWWFPVFINKGDLDYYLTRPVSPLFFLSLREFAANSFINLIFAIGIFAWAILQLTAPIHFFHLFFYILFILNGVVIVYLLHMFFYLPVLWTGSPRGFESLLYGLDSMVKYPDKIQNTFFRLLFTFVIPMNLIVSFPARFFFDNQILYTASIMIGCSIIIWVLFLWLWNKALKQYSSASS